MSDTNMTLTQEERDCLTELLQLAIKEARVEEHRTRTLSFREHILEREHVLADILKKLGAPAK